MTIKPTALASAVAYAFAVKAFADGCDKIRFSDVGWIDITSTTAISTLVL